MASAEGSEPRRAGRPRAAPVATELLPDLRAYDRLRAGRLFNSYQAIKVLAFCSVWQRSGGTMEGVLRSGLYGRRTAYSRLANCRQAGFEPELVQWRTRTGPEWEDFADLMYRHADEEYVRELEEYERRPLPGRLIRRRPRRDVDLLEDPAE
jgi:hypothetical protein